jgi:hypothetical protein
MKEEKREKKREEKREDRGKRKEESEKNLSFSFLISTNLNTYVLGFCEKV